MTDKRISLNDKCNGCGICTKVCPAHNILMKEKKTVWLYHCEMCFACDEWCPKEAIQHWGRAKGIKNRHPEVKISDMFRQNQYLKLRVY